jgi:hypothetical protein
MIDDPRSKAVLLASKAFQAVRDRDMVRVDRIVQRIVVECGTAGVRAAVWVWVNRYIDYAYDGRPAPGFDAQETAFMRAQAGKVPPPATARMRSWAVQVLAARISGDDPAFGQAIARLQPHSAASYLSAAVRQWAGATTLLPRGFARPAEQGQ